VAKDPRFGFLGNVSVGKDVHVPELLNMYNAVVFAYGASSDRDMGIPGENLKNVTSARAFVNWYNGHPSFRDFSPNLDTEDVVIIGNGNVAVDCARVLCKSPEELKVTDIASHAVEALSKSKVKRVHVVGRRGHIQAAVTMKELRELTRLEGTTFHVDGQELALGRNTSSLAELESARARKRMDALLAEQAALSHPSSPSGKQLFMRFLLSPVACKPLSQGIETGAVGSFEFERVALEGPADKQKAVGTGKMVTIPAGLVLKSIGYKSLAMPGVPFDPKSATMPNEKGRVMDTGKLHVPRLYCSGWLKRGPNGIIGTNITDARETVASILEDKAAGKLGEAGNTTKGLPALKSLLASRGLSPTSVLDWKGWLKVDAEEVARGAASGKIREKVTSVPDMLRIGNAK